MVVIGVGLIGCVAPYRVAERRAAGVQERRAGPACSSCAVRAVSTSIVVRLAAQGCAWQAPAPLSFAQQWV